LIVVDNGSIDETANVCGRSRLDNITLKYICERRAGLSFARNAGIRAATGEVILFTDDDVRPPHDWVERMCRPILSGGAGAVAGAVALASDVDRPWMDGYSKALLAWTDPERLKQPSEMVGANMAFSRKVLDSVPYFDIELGAGAVGFGDDSVFSWCIVQKGYRLVGAPDAAVTHHPDSNRLLRLPFLQMVEKSGRTIGYLNYHREHRNIKGAYLRLAKNCLLLQVLRCLKRPGRIAEGAAKWERDLVLKIGLIRQTIIERGRPRRYFFGGCLRSKFTDEIHRMFAAPNEVVGNSDRVHSTRGHLATGSP
jgi:glycosyltransferase involved in cell wall biosynthesis